MNALKATAKVIFEVDYSDLEKTITDYFRENHNFSDNEYYEFPDLEEVSNGTCQSYNIDGQLSDWNLKDIQKIIEAKSFRVARYQAQTIVNYLCSKGVIPSGAYVIKVFW